MYFSTVPIWPSLTIVVDKLVPLNIAPGEILKIIRSGEHGEHGELFLKICKFISDESQLSAMHNSKPSKICNIKIIKRI